MNRYLITFEYEENGILAKHTVQNQKRWDHHPVLLQTELI
jgi:hypothetical protein